MCACSSGGSNSETATPSQAALEPIESSELSALFGDATSFKGRGITIPVMVSEVEGLVEGEGYKFYGPTTAKYENPVYVICESDEGLKRDDILIVEGVIEGKDEIFDYPIIKATSITKSDYTAFNPAIKTIDSGDVVEQEGIKVTLDKVEIAADSTRLYLTIENKSGAEASIYDFNSVIVQDGKQFKDSDIAYNEKTLDTDIVNDVTADGILSFAAVDAEGGELKISLDISSDDYDKDKNIEPFEFTITLDGSAPSTSADTTATPSATAE